MRRVLVGLLGLGMAVLSFDALRAYALTGRALTDGVIPAATIAPRPWLAMLWAVVVDLAVLAGILGIKDDRHDWRAWLMLLLALGATLGFQVFALSPFVARAVPPVGLALAILVLDLGPGRPKPAIPDRPPVPARFRAWIESGRAAPTQPALARPAELPTVRPSQDVAGPRSTSQQAAASSPPRPNGLTSTQRRRVEGWVGEGRTNVSQMQRDLGVKSDRFRKDHLAPLVRDLLAAQNGDRPKVDA